MIAFFPTLHRFSIILANIEGRIKIKDIFKFSMARALTKYDFFIHRCPQTWKFCTTCSEIEIRLHTLYMRKFGKTTQEYYTRITVGLFVNSLVKLVLYLTVEHIYEY